MKGGYLRNFVFGVEDSIVSTVGFLSGIATSSIQRHELLIAGGVLIFVEAFSMGTGSYLSEQSSLEARYGSNARFMRSFWGGIVMFLSYLITGFLVLLPYVISFGGQSVLISVLFSLFLLFLLGIISARMTGLPILWRGFRMMVIGGIAVILGILVARFLEGV